METNEQVYGKPDNAKVKHNGGFTAVDGTKIENKKFYIASEHKRPFLNVTPSIPNNHFVRIGAEDKAVKRVSVSSSYDGALILLDKQVKGKLVYIYELEEYKGEVVMVGELKGKKLVPTTHITGEHWLLSTAKFRHVATVRVYEPRRHPYRFNYMHDGKPREGRVYGWVYRKLSENETDTVGQKINRKLSGIVKRNKEK